MADALTSMATVLLKLPTSAPPDPVKGRTARLRALLAVGPMTARDLASSVGLATSGLVSSLLKQDLRDGRISATRGGLYRLTRIDEPPPREATVCSIARHHFQEDS